MFEQIKKRDGQIEEFQSLKITKAIQKAGETTGEFSENEAKKMTMKTVTLAVDLRLGPVPEVEEIQDIVERVLLDSPFYKTAKKYIIYREQTEQTNRIKHCSFCLKEDGPVVSVRPKSFIKVCKECNDKLSLSLDRGEYIKRSITFPPEYKQAGISILSYFSEVIQQKYPSMDVKVKIEQLDKKVSMIVETPDGEINKVEKVLDEYGLVIMGVLPPEELLNNETNVLELKHKIEIANLEVRQTRDLLCSEREQQFKRITTLEGQVEFLQNIVGNGLQSNSNITTRALDLLEIKIKKDAFVIDKLIKVLGKKIEQITDERFKKDIQEVLPKANESTDSFLEKLRDKVMNGTITNTGGRLLYDFINNLPH